MNKIVIKYNPKTNNYSKPDLRQMILSDGSLNDMEKLANYFENFKDEIRQKDTSLYYLLLGVFDGKIQPYEPSSYWST